MSEQEITVESVGGIDVEPTIDLLLPLIGKHLEQREEEKLKQAHEQASSRLSPVEQGPERRQYRRTAS